jgi:Tfp pilus assembly protein PilN
MRPVNLIPAEERQGSRRTMRSGPLPYIVFGALLLALGAVTLLVVTDNQISSRKDELARVKDETAQAEAVAQSLAPYVTFHQISTSRDTTITNLANSRFDWQKVMAQLARILPQHVSFSSLTATVRPGVSVGGGESVSLRGASPGPGLSFAGCAADQEEVAALLTALKEIDGVTRVGLQESSINSEGANGSAVSAGGSCGKDYAHFQIAAVFDAAPVPASPTGGEVAVPAPVEEAAPESAEAASTEAPAEGE